MPSIKINDNEILDARRIKSFKASEQESGAGTDREMVLTLTTDDGKDLTLRGELADAALAILRLHGF
jgi:hypothetical protein